jgi:CBS domain-containing protein
MKLAALIHGKGHEIVKIRDNQNIAEAAIALTEHKIGALLVEGQDGQAPHGADLHDVSVSELMTTNVIRCSPNDSVNEAMAMMTDRRIRHLPVFEGDELVGFISIGDLVKCRIMEVQSEAEALRQYITS